MADFALPQKAEPFVFDVDSLFYHLDCLTDRRKPKGIRYPLAIALVFVILAKLAGEDEPDAIAHWVSLRKQLLIEALKLKRNTTPHATTFSRILGQLVEVNELQQTVTQFLLSTLQDGLSVKFLHRRQDLARDHSTRQDARYSSAGRLSSAAGNRVDVAG